MGPVSQQQLPARQAATLASTNTEIDARYTIPAASALDYQVNITAYNQNSHWGYYGLGGWYGMGGWYGGMGGWYGGMGGYGWYGGGMAGWWNPWWHGAYRWLADPAEPALDPGFWNLRGAVDRVLAAGSQYADGDYANPFALLHTHRLPALPESLPSPPSDSPTAPPDADSPAEPEIVTIAYDPDEVIEILEEHHPVLAQFWATRGRIVRAPVSGRTRTDGGKTVGAGLGSRYADSSKASSPDGLDIYDSRAYESVWVQVPDDWGSWRVALLIMDVAAGRARSESTSDLADQFDRFIEARFADANALSDQPDEEADAPADPYEDAVQRAIAVKLGSLDPEDLPYARIFQLINEGKAVSRIKYIGRTPVRAAAIPLPLADGTIKSLILEWVPPGWFSKPRWRMVGVGPDITHYSLEQAMDTYVFSPRRANAAQQAANIAELALHIIPLGAAADNFSQGKYVEGTISLAGDGFGGCTVSLVSSEHLESVAHAIHEGYRNQTGIVPSLFTTRPAAGAHVVVG